MRQHSVSSKTQNQKHNLLEAMLCALAAMVAGALLGASTVGFIYLLVFGYYVFTPEIVESREVARELAIGWAPSLFSFLVLACWHSQLGIGVGDRVCVSVFW